MTETKIIIAGFGGQGVVLAGSLLAQAALIEGKNVLGMVSYGVEVRGGTAFSSIVISDKEINSPVIDKADFIVALNQPSADKYKDRLSKEGVMVVNTSLVKELPNGINISKIAATEIANSIGNVKVANVVAIGHLLKILKEVDIDSAVTALDKAFISKPELIEINKKAILKGVQYG